MNVNEYALEWLAGDRLVELRAEAARQRLARESAPTGQGWVRRAITASSWHFRQPYAVRPSTPGASNAAS
jgi:hypothetical protein